MENLNNDSQVLTIDPLKTYWIFILSPAPKFKQSAYFKHHRKPFQVLGEEITIRKQEYFYKYYSLDYVYETEEQAIEGYNFRLEQLETLFIESFEKKLKKFKRL